MVTAEKIGYGFNGTRRDGRVFSGEITKVCQTAKGTLVVVKNGADYKSFYMENITGHSVSLCNGQPWWPGMVRKG